MPEAGRKWIPHENCKHGYTYRIKSRNLIVGVFNSDDGGFVGIREKLGDLYLFPEYHYDNGPPYGTVQPLREIEKCPVEDIRDHLDTICGACKKVAEWKSSGQGGMAGAWFHLEPSDCGKVDPVRPQNQPLYDYLSVVEKKVEREILIEELEEGLQGYALKGKDDWSFKWHLQRAIRCGAVTEADLPTFSGESEETIKEWLEGKSTPPLEIRKALYEKLLQHVQAIA